MPSIFYPLIFIFLTNFFLEPTTCALPAYLQNLELDDITSLWDKFPSIIAQIKQAVNRFRCPKGWRRLGGSCYYLSNLTSTPTEANQTCNQLHSNHSNLMQIRNTVELLYAAHVLTKNNLSALMIEIDPKLLKGKTMAEILMDDQGRWKRMKDKFREVRIRYYKLKEKILDELNAAGLRISRRSKKIKQSVKKRKEKFIYDHVDSDYYDDYQEYNMTNDKTSNDTVEIDEYEYENLDTEEEGDDFERIEDVRGICDQIDWNVLNNNATVYLLSTYLNADKIVCSLSNVEDDFEYEHLCEYVLDFCFANIICGKHGHCVNTLSGFKCSCSFLYGGLLCERISKQGKQILVGILLVLVLYGLSIKPIRWLLITAVKTFIHCCKRRRRVNQHKKKTKKIEAIEDKEKLVPTKKTEENAPQAPYMIDQRRQTIVEEFIEFLLPRTAGPIENPNKRDLIRLFWVGGLSVLLLTILLSVTTLTHFTSFKYDIVNETKFDALINETIQLVARCGTISNYRKENLLFFPFALVLIFLFSWSVKREKRCLNVCDSRPGLIPPIEPFRTANRFTTATVFGILAFEVLKIFEELLFATADPLNRGILIELLERIAIVVLMGLRYYPILASLQLRNIAARFFVCPYVLAGIVYTIIREGSCMGFLPLSRYYSALEEATLRMEIGTWFIIYGLIKNTPHFILLSYITAELFVRFAYDSVYVPIKKKQSIWSSPMAQPDESAFAKYYVQKLFRRNRRATQPAYSTEADIDNMEDHEHEEELQRNAKPSRVKRFFDSIYHWDDDFRFTTMATCTYTVAMIFLYYLACTLVFLYISRTTGHISFIRHYIETTLNIEFQGFFSLRSTIITSAFITVVLFGFQLFVGMQNYKKHKLQLFKGMYEDVPSAANFKPNSIAAKSVHYSGFLVGYMAWGFVICFHLIFLLLSAIRIISVHMRYFELILAITVPVLVVYLLKILGTSSAGTFLFVQDSEEKLNLKNRKVYAIFVYFNFFADCFLGIASCIIRLIKATFLNVVYMARLDCSFLGRPLERYDLGFAAYVSYLHMEVTHTNPIMLAFCYSLYDDAVKRRPNHSYDDECCIAAAELDNEEVPSDQIQKNVQSVSSKTSDRSGNGSVSKKTKVHAEETARPVAKKQMSIDTDDDGLSVKEVKPKAKSPSPSTISEKNSQKFKPKKLSIDNNIEEQKKDDNGGSPPPVTSAIARLIPQKQPRLPSPSAPIPDAPPREDLSTEEEDDDGGLKPSSTSTVSKVIPQQPPRLLPKQTSSPPRVPPRQDSVNDEDDDGGIIAKPTAKQKPEPEKKKKKKHVADDDDEDDDGGLQPPSITSISKIIPQQAPSLLPVQHSSSPGVAQQAPRFAPVPRPSAPMMPQQGSRFAPNVTQQAPRFAPMQQVSPSRFAPMQQSSPLRFASMQQSSPPRVPLRQDIANDDDDDGDDGGLNPKIIAKQKQELEKKKKKKEESKKKQQQLDDDYDDDGGLSKAKYNENKKTKSKSKSKTPLILDDEDDDGGVSKERRIAAQKKKQELEAKKKKKEDIKAKVKHDDDEDDDGAPKREEPINKKKPTKIIAKADILKEEDEDDDGGRIVQTHDTIKMILPPKRPVLDHQTKKSPSPEATDDGSMLTSRPQHEPLLKSYDIVGRMVPKISADDLKHKEGNHYDIIQTDSERAAQAQPIYSPPSYDKATNSNDLYLLRTESYLEATQKTPPVFQRRPTGSSLRSHSNTNEDSSHYSEITIDTHSSGAINRSYSHTGSIQSTSNHSIKQQSKQSSQQTLKEEQQTEESTVGTDEEDEEEEEEEEEEEQEEEERSKEKPLKAQLKPLPNVSTAFATISHLVHAEKAAELQIIVKQKQARFRWFLAYTLINNYHLFDLRKQVQSRLARLHIERSNLIDDEQHVIATAAAAAEAVGEKTLKAATTLTTEIPASPGSPRRLLSAPGSITTPYRQSPAERYVAIRSSMLYDVNSQQADTPRSPVISPVPSTVSQQPRFPMKSNLNAKSFGFQTAPTVIIQPPSDSTTPSKGKRPSYQRQETEISDPLMINQLTGTPVFQGVPSTADYPIANGSSITNYSTLRTQMSHAQHMQAWRQNQVTKLQKKRPHCYHYGAPLQRSLEEKVAAAAILTPQIIPPGNNLKRLPSSSPFPFPPQEKTKNASATDENKAAIKKKALQTTVALVHRKDSQTSFSNVTKV